MPTTRSQSKKRGNAIELSEDENIDIENENENKNAKKVSEDENENENEKETIHESEHNIYEHSDFIDKSDKEIKNIIRENWKSGTHPSSFKGITNVKRYYPSVSLELVKDALAGIDTYTLFRKEKNPKHKNPIYVREKRRNVQADLIDMQHRAEDNDNVRYLLAVIDAFTRFAWIEPIKNKQGETVLKAFKNIEKRVPEGIGTFLLTDAGSEFIYKGFQDYLQSKNIERGIPNDHAAHVERFNQTIKADIEKYLEENQTNRYIDMLPNLTQLYNNQRHSTIKMSPANAEKEQNRGAVLEAVNEYYKKATGPRKQPKFKIGDWVRISAFKSKFHKSYKMNFKPDIYVIYEIRTKMPIPMYKLKSLDKGEPIIGTWYESQLQKVSKDVEGAEFKIERIVKTRKRKGEEKEYLIKWMYYPESENTWEPEHKIRDLHVRNS